MINTLFLYLIKLATLSVPKLCGVAVREGEQWLIEPGSISDHFVSCFWFS